MNTCPNCLASNSFMKVHKDGAVIEVCEYCNTVMENKTTREDVLKSENEIQNVEEGKVLGIILWILLIIFISIISILNNLHGF
ncbi:hypothetical protein ACIQZG_24370 [Lysinibacillus sp. NPDC096418]|uniref:hypothetical protein n=1 Tax=Lysinibacillus sp. NPDC096418 TaxID=3364138 RepID=UPI003823732B